MGRGTRFRILLPLVPFGEDGALEPSDEHASPAALLRGDEHILVVEDEAVVRTVTAQMLASFGYRVSTATDGEDALAMLDEHADVNLVVTDLSMPRMGGLELALALQQRRSQLPIVFMSAHLDLPEPRERVEAGEAYFVQKPATREQLATQLRAALLAAEKP